MRLTYSSIFPPPNETVQKKLSFHNRFFEGYLSRCAWLLNSSDLDDWLPWTDFARSLRAIGRDFLGTGHPMPFLLGEPPYHDFSIKSGDITTIQEFWHAMPEAFDKRVSFACSELPALFCALAEPPRFGTAPGRYPDQLQKVREWMNSSGLNSISILDVGCGTGLGTLELASSCNAHLTIGITPEPLEIKMAQCRCLPHDPKREVLFRRYDKQTADFLPGSAENFCLPQEIKFNAIFCNGLVGGPMLQSVCSMNKFLDNCHRHLLPGGRIFIANRFHDGRAKDVIRLLSLAHTPFNDWRNAQI